MRTLLAIVFLLFGTTSYSYGEIIHFIENNPNRESISPDQLAKLWPIDSHRFLQHPPSKLGLPESDYLTEMVWHANDHPNTGKIVIGGGWCSAERFPGQARAVTAGHCKYSSSGPIKGGIFVLPNGEQFPITQTWVTSRLIQTINVIPSEEDYAIIGWDTQDPTPPPPLPRPCRRRCRSYAKTLTAMPVSIEDPGINRIVTVRGYSSGHDAGNNMVKFTSITMRLFDSTTYIFGGNMEPGISGAVVLCDAGNPAPEDAGIQFNVWCGILTLYVTDGTGTTVQNGAAFLNEPAWSDLLTTAGIQ
ncbi:MAG: hypothetical protein COU90_02485 [Candidatus Ryanbacteria bacterium CG10_big_fil_rev_8_21_14_0_10_43_42]|uniref:Peptidase S1 domain-containing protein n=1 Tax=Candidatus Ryanbacteria bacterium CG10_big_fil_rev_8_21_14_0_10_43_42 TaxID=1974864 RepID=A0A2M8KWI2_9BACT|nr:MAG: hypothetical protein COU90_02485 [Candidatus Ryanbacteria bacterium CG10_big_fil_rev_8_21_14_0_10_43_42]